MRFHDDFLYLLLVGGQGFAIELVRQVEGFCEVGYAPFDDELGPLGARVFDVQLFAREGVFVLYGFSFEEGVVDVFEEETLSVAVAGTYEELAGAAHPVVDFIARRHVSQLACFVHAFAQFPPPRVGIICVVAEGILEHHRLLIAGKGFQFASLVLEPL